MLGKGENILEAKYDAIKYLQFNSSFLVETNKNKGIISSEGKTLIQPQYEDLTLIDTKNNYYLAKKNNLYGVIDENGKEIIYIENEQVGLDISNYSVNGIKNGYILLDKLIPVMQNKKWGFYDLKGNKVKGFEYDMIGCTLGNGTNTYGLLILPDYELIVVQKDKKYSFMNSQGKDNILPFSFDAIYIKVESGQMKYYMMADKKSYNVTGTLEKMGVTKKSNTGAKQSESTTNNTNENKTATNTTKNESKSNTVTNTTKNNQNTNTSNNSKKNTVSNN